MGMIKVMFKGREGQIFSADGISFPAGKVVEVEKLPKGVWEVRLTEGQRKSLGLKHGEPPFEIDGYEPELKVPAEQKEKKTSTKSRGK